MRPGLWSTGWEHCAARRQSSGASPAARPFRWSLFFTMGGALENMQEEIIPLIPVLLLLGRGIGVDALTVVAMSAGAAMVGSAFGPTNPFQAGIAPAGRASAACWWRNSRRDLDRRVCDLGAWTMRHAVRNPQSVEVVASDGRTLTRRDLMIVVSFCRSPPTSMASCDSAGDSTNSRRRF